MQKKSNITHQIIIRTVNTSNTCRYHFLRTSTNWKCKKALISPNYSFVSRFTSSDVMWYGCDITMHSIGLVWLILSISQALITFNIPTSCIASENKEKLIKKTADCVYNLCVRMCNKLFRVQQFVFACSSSDKSFRDAEQNGKLKAKVRTARDSTQFVSLVCYHSPVSLPSCLAGWMFFLLGFTTTRRTDKHRHTH